jgi:hypothetical protein
MLKALDGPELLVVTASAFRELTAMDVVLGVALAAVLSHTTELPTILVALATLESFMHTD